MGRIFLKLQPPIDLADSIALIKKFFKKELNVLSGNSCADAFETKSSVNDSIVK